MPQIIDYLIKLSGTLMVLYLFYWIGLRHLTFYTSNRWYLLGYSIAAFFIPFINISPLLQTAELENDQFVQWVPVINAQELHPNNAMVAEYPFWQSNDTVFVLFISGIVVMMIRFILRYFSVRSVRSRARLLSDGEVKIYHSDKNIIPFSFGKSIFINKYRHSEDDLQDIIRHEFIHVKQNHTVDILLSEWLCILNWYNPFAWLIRNAIRQNLEFIADNKVLENGVDKKQYQYLLLKVVGVHQNGITTSFNFTSLKKRIAMMNKMRSARRHFLRFLFVIPLLAVILLAFRNKLNDHELNKDTTLGTLIMPPHPENEKLIIDTIPSSKKPETHPHTFYVPKPNSKGFIITVADNHGECIVIVKDKQQKIVKAVSLVEWDENEKKYKGEYGEILSPRPVEPPAASAALAAPVASAAPTGFAAPVASAVPAAPATPAALAAPEPIQMPENISSIHVKNKILTLVNKDGEVEIYDLDKPEQKASFEKKYGTKAVSPQKPKPLSKPGNESNSPVKAVNEKEN